MPGIIRNMGVGKMVRQGSNQNSGIPLKSDALFWLDGTISGTQLIDKSGNNRNFTITGKDFPSTWTKGIPYKSASTISAPIGDATLIAADVHNFLYTAGTPNQIPIVSFFQDIEYAHKLFCRHSPQILDANNIEVYEARVLEIVLYNTTKTGEDLTTCQTYFSVPTVSVGAKYVSGDYATNTAAIAALSNGAVIYDKSGLYVETYGNRLDLYKQLSIKGIGFARINHNTGGSSLCGMSGNASIEGLMLLATGAAIGLRINGSNNVIKRILLNGGTSVYQIIKEGGENTLIKDSIFIAEPSNCLTYLGNNIVIDSCLVIAEFLSNCMIAYSFTAGSKHTVRNSRIRTSSYLCNTLVPYIDFIGNEVISNNTVARFLIGSPVAGSVYNILNNKFSANSAGGASFNIISSQSGNVSDFIIKNNISYILDRTGQFINITVGRSAIIESNITGGNKAIINMTGLTVSASIKYNRLTTYLAPNNDLFTGVVASKGTGSQIPISIEGNSVLNPRHFGEESGYHACILVHTYIDSKVKYNYVSGAGIANIVIKSASNVTNSDCQCSYNVSDFAGVVSKGQSNVMITNNTIVDAKDYGVVLMPGDDLTKIQSCKVKNNIVVNQINNDYLIYVVDEDSTSRHDIDYNVYFSNAATPFSHDGVAKTWAEWQALGYDAHSIMLTTEEFVSLFNDFANKDFSINANSRAVGAGINLGESYQVGLSANTYRGSDSMPPQIITKNQSVNWDAGAYIH